jgi:uncharacterized protein with HEPN domain
MADLPERDAALLLDMLMAARDALSFVQGLDEARFLANRLHQNAVIRSLEIIGDPLKTQRRWVNSSWSRSTAPTASGL